MRKLEIKNYSFSYPNCESKALDNINLTVKQGDFLLLCGKSGSGKSTLLRNLKAEVAPLGISEGEILFDGSKLCDKGDESAAKIGFVFQSPENQIVTDTVRHELAFGLENLGLPSNVIRRRVAETANFFGIDDWFFKKVSDLSGGQKQILNLASIVAMQPELVLLDEPTSQLDPVASKNFLNLLERLNTELGMTVVMCEHNLEEVLDITTKVGYMDEGRCTVFSSPEEFAKEIPMISGFSSALPASVTIAKKLGFEEMPLSVRKARELLHSSGISLKTPVKNGSVETPAVISASDIWFRYSSNGGFILKGTSIDIKKGEIHSIVGGNGSGKSTLLKVLSGIKKYSMGKIKKAKDAGRCAMLMQDPKTLFVCDTVMEEFKELQQKFSYSDEDIFRLSDIFGITHLMDRHPYDISGGEMQKTAFVKLLLTKPDILLLDEPTKGVDAEFKQEIAKYLAMLKNDGKAIILVTHDLDFAARTSDRCSFMFGGEIICSDNAKEFFAGNNYYTTSTNRITRGIENRCVLPEDVEYDS